jgi:large subunit ribosomal protein L10
MSRFLKALMKDQLASRFDGVDGGVVISTAGLNSELTYDFRKTLHEQKLKYTVVRNSLIKNTFEEMGYPRPALNAHFKGQCGIVWGAVEGSAMAGARAVSDWKKERKDKVVAWKGAFMEGAVMGPQEAQDLKDAPTRDQAYAMLAGILQAPITQLLATVAEPAKGMVYVMDAYKRKLEDGGGSAAS